ncbi:hypothetical protein CMI47_13835 [Candidatus Pacearchaeota archaeon]|nr:hypothetical protein [Candidatus Pacearchaeota archaeon]|tara:strand:- start:320 stop:1102 length:783 start_codon:yes stop_codon:yes gene_type:complete
MLSVVQNFICTIPERLDLIERNTPSISEVWGEYEFFINFNHEQNFEEVYSIYKENIPKLNFYHNLEKDWASVTLSLMNEVTTPYVLFINEDQELYMTKDDWSNIVNEALVENDVDYILMNKIEKYNTQVYAEGYVDNPEDQASRIIISNWGRYPSPGYDEGKYVWFYKGKYAPHKRICTEGVYKTEWFKELLTEFIEKGESCTHDIPYRKKNISNFYEGYYDFDNGTARFPDLKCAMAKKNISKQWNEIKQNRIWYNENN